MRKVVLSLTILGSQGYCKPFATRPLVLVSLLLLTLTLIALTEYACRSLPNHAGIGALGNVVNGTLKRDLEANIKREPAQNVARLETCDFVLLTDAIAELTSLFQSFLSSQIHYHLTICFRLLRVQAQVQAHQ